MTKLSIPANKPANKPTELLAVYKEYSNACYKCEIAKYCEHKVTAIQSHPRNLNNVHLLFVGDAPSEEDYARGIPFVGNAGLELTTILELALSPSIKYALTNCILCTPFTDSQRSTIRTPSLPEIAGCRGHLERLIETVKPLHVIALGKLAEKSLKKVLPYQSYVPNTSRSFSSVMHPASIIKSSHPDLERSRVVLHIKSIAEKIYA